MRYVLLSFLMMAVLAGPVAAQEYSRTVSDIVPLSANGTVSVENHEGSIRITSWDRDEVEFEARIVSDVSQEGVDAAHIDVSSDSDEFRLRSDFSDVPDGEWTVTFFGVRKQSQQPAVHYTLSIPASASVQIDDHESTIELTGLGGAVDVETHEGPITVRDLTGDLEIDAHESEMDLAALAGTVELDVHEGEIRIDGLEGDLEVEGHDPELRVDGLRGGLELASHEPDARIAFAAFTRDVRIDTHDGEVHLTLPSDTGFRLLTDFSDDARLQSDFDLSEARQFRKDDDDPIQYDGPINGGGPGLHIRSHDGAFRVYAGE